MVRELGTVSFDDYLQLTGRDPASPRDRRAALRRRILNAVVLSGCIVLSFAAGIHVQPEGKTAMERQPRGLAIGSTDWPTVADAQRRLVTRGMNDAIAYVNFQSSVALERPVDGQIVRDCSLIALRNIAQAAIQGLERAENADSAFAARMLDEVREQFHDTK